MSSGTSALSPFNTEQLRPTLARLKKQDSENIVLILRSTRRLPLSLRFISTLVSTLRNLLNLHLANPKVDDFPFSIQSAILYALLKLICYAFIQPCSFGRSLSTRLAGRIINHFCTRYAIFLCSFEFCHLLELYVQCAALYRTFIPQSFWNTRCGRPRGRKFHLTRSLVTLEGWSSVRDRTDRKHCPSHEIWSYKKYGEGGRSTGVLLYICQFFIDPSTLRAGHIWPMYTVSADMSKSLALSVLTIFDKLSVSPIYYPSTQNSSHAMCGIYGSLLYALILNVIFFPLQMGIEEGTGK